MHIANVTRSLQRDKDNKLHRVTNKTAHLFVRCLCCLDCVKIGAEYNLCKFVKEIEETVQSCKVGRKTFTCTTELVYSMRQSLLRLEVFKGTSDLLLLDLWNTHRL
jgi:hypothetical protein